MRREAPRTEHAAWLAMASWGYASGAHGSVAPFVARSFGLDDAGIATLTAWLGLSALIALGLGGAVDRFGRRRVLLICVGVLPIGCAATAHATGPVVYVVAQILTQAAGGTIAATVAVLLAEGLASRDRAEGQGRAGSAFAVAAALPLVLVFALAESAEPWRGVWLAGALPLLAWPWLRRRLAESARWEAAARRGETSAARITDAFRGEHRERAATVLAAVVLISGAEVAIRGWLFYHPVSTLGVDPRTATIILLVCGGLGLFGFRLGARLADRVGRRRAFGAAATTGVAAAFVYYGLSGWLVDGQLACLAIGLLLVSTAGNAATVAFRSLATELMPTRVRGAVGGWLAVGTALGWLLSMSCIAWWAPLVGGVGPAVVTFVTLALPGACLALARLPETAGLELEAAAAEPLRGPA